MKLTALTTLAKPNPEPANAAEQRKLAEATRQFEAVLIRQMLTSLEKTTKLSSSSGPVGGQSAYSSMMVDALSDAIACAGGLGLAQSLQTAIQGQLAATRGEEAPAKNDVKPSK